MENPVPEADGIKLAETEDRSARDPQGGGPGKRKRGFHRALKRGEPWAKSIDMINKMSRLNATIIRQLFNPDPILQDIILSGLASHRVNPSADLPALWKKP